jgi:hypothetical protein
LRKNVYMTLEREEESMKIKCILSWQWKMVDGLSHGFLLMFLFYLEYESEIEKIIYIRIL